MKCMELLKRSYIKSTLENIISLFCPQVILLEEKSYGFVTFARKADALAALDALGGCLINGKRFILRRKKRTSGDLGTDFACGARYGSHRKLQDGSTGKYSDIGGGATFAWGTCFTCGRPGHKMLECPIKFSYGMPECVNEDPDEDFKVYVENLPSEVAWQEVRELFEKEVGKVCYAMPRTLESGGEGCRGIIGRVASMVDNINHWSIINFLLKKYNMPKDRQFDRF